MRTQSVASLRFAYYLIAACGCFHPFFLYLTQYIEGATFKNPILLYLNFIFINLIVLEAVNYLTRVTAN